MRLLARTLVVDMIGVVEMGVAQVLLFVRMVMGIMLRGGRSVTGRR